MPRTRVKICGICRPEDAAVAGRLGADAIGIVRAEEAARYVTIENARRIAAVLPAFATPVLLYVDASPDQILSDLAALGRPAMVQLNGGESAMFIRDLEGALVLKSLRADEDLQDNLTGLAGLMLPNLAGVVLESPGQIGGSGLGNDWELIRSLKDAGAFNGAPPLIAAGGLSPANVGQVVRSIRPFAVDVSSGVDESKDNKREKSESKIAAFIAAVREADS